MKREDMKAASKFRATCDRCGARSGVVTAGTAGAWASNHEFAHRALDRKRDAS